MAKGTNSEKKRVFYSRKKKDQLVRLWERSGQSKATFCREQGLRYFTFAGWVYNQRRKVSADSEQGKFLPMVLSEPQQRVPFACVVVNGITVEIFQPVDASYLRSLAGA